MAKAISYVRFSTPKQALGDSLRRQLEQTRDYCAKHGLTLDETLTDAGLSGYKGEHVRHGALGRFLAAVEAGQVERGTCLIIEHLDRFSRQNTRIALTLLLNLINSGIQVITLFNEQTYSDTSANIEHDLIGAILYMSEAHKASARKADLITKTWEGKRQKVASGERKILTSTRPAWLDVADGKFKPNPKGRIIIRRIFEEVASGLSTYQVCQRLNDGKVPPLTGNKMDRETGKSKSNGWNNARISEIIRSDAPLGWFQPHKRDGKTRVKVGDPIPDYYPQVITQDLADRARYQLSQRKFSGVGSGAVGETVTNLFTGLAKCAICGSNMYMYNHGTIGGHGKRPRAFHSGHLRCSNNARQMGCENAGKIAYGAFEQFVVAMMGDLSIPHNDVGHMDNVMQDLVERHADAKASVVKTSDAIKTWMGAYEDKPSPVVLARIEELDAQRIKLTDDVAELDKAIKTEKGKSKPDDALAAIRAIISQMDSTNPETRLMARTRVSAGMKRIVSNFLCFPNRSVIAQYNLGWVLTTFMWLQPDGEYGAYLNTWDFGEWKGKPYFTAPVADWKTWAKDYDPDYITNNTSEIILEATDGEPYTMERLKRKARTASEGAAGFLRE